MLCMRILLFITVTPESEWCVKKEMCKLIETLLLLMTL